MFSSTWYFKTEMEEPKEKVWNFFQKNDNLVAITGFPKIELEGDRTVYEGAQIVLHMNFYLFKLRWEGAIVERQEGAYFIDEGRKLPFPFRSWRHTHAFKETAEGKTRMIDRVEFSSWLPAPLIKLMLAGMFSDRKRQLRMYFKHVN
ncbi:SRPBCC family protein [Alkalicoccus urumqiensis]|uniref:Ligand-binding SRPBCC domain-containing protein n=1 Tax=Alkalicoccus urumqiensis TaxID=1548213 RepID=A0A2P6MKB9_ALKUR|nr:hypothetical protein [Alkalicoccus urumqiensis]PRO66742.1 hypothetical protein C6I21_02105 [Alkalicoccus urumqiensis]